MAAPVPAEYERLEPLAGDSFVLPTNSAVGAHRATEQDAPCIYFAGNSLGPMPKLSKQRVEEELAIWGERAVVGHFKHPQERPWMTYCERIHPLFAEVVGAKESEVVCMGTLTANLHLMLESFYAPTQERYKILCEAKAFPSDQYAFASKVLAHGFDPKVAVREIAPREGEFTLREEDILDVIEKEGDEIAVVLFSGIQYYTGQFFPMQRITAKAHEKGCIAGWDLAHAAGNVPLSLHDWDVDFAVWCTYKYLNAGPGSTAGLFMHEKWNATKTPRAAGWWGHNETTRFQMPPTFDPIAGAQGFQQSNIVVLASAAVLGGLETLQAAGGMGPFRQRALKLTALLERLLVKSKYYVPVAEAGKRTEPGFTIITPEDPEQRGAQLSLLFLPSDAGVMRKMFHALESFGVIGDERDPAVIRLTANPLYSSSDDVVRCAEYLDAAFKVEGL
ncbi:pyridoxal phosphate-dependent transferase [Schizophyllum amplum]|uniref:Kynureninase n=1 Tax=Schizophyllum amplum TaxID=97359 RepID=A0A550CAV1_9AGAR|nr:pyridoxal phosphate-dependent transferase [Auriculariopsis ampla]